MERNSSMSSGSYDALHPSSTFVHGDSWRPPIVSVYDVGLYFLFHIYDWLYIILHRDQIITNVGAPHRLLEDMFHTISSPLEKTAIAQFTQKKMLTTTVVPLVQIITHEHMVVYRNTTGKECPNNTRGLAFQRLGRSLQSIQFLLIHQHRRLGEIVCLRRECSSHRMRGNTPILIDLG